METMKAWVLSGPGHLALTRVPVPVCGPRDVLIRIRAVSLCNGSDPAMYRGSEACRPPCVFGHEAVGEITQIGAEVRDFTPGQRVVWWCALGAFPVLACVCPEKLSMFVPPPEIPDERAAILELVIAAGRALMPFEEETEGRTLRIAGLGPSGLVSVMNARALGFARIEGWDLRPERRALALRLGADSVLDPQDVGFDPHTLDRADLTLDMAADDPTGHVLTDLCRCARDGGTLVSYGHPLHGRSFSPYVFQSANLTLCSPTNDHRIIRQKGIRLLRGVADNAIDLRPLIADVHDFSRLGACLEELLQNPWTKLKRILVLDKEA